MARRHPVDIVNEVLVDPVGDLVVHALEQAGFRLTRTSRALPRWVDPETQLPVNATAKDTDDAA